MVYFSSAAFLVCFVLRTAVARDEHQRVRYSHTDRHVNTTIRRSQKCEAAVTRFELVNALKDTIISKLPDVIDYDNRTFASGMNIIARTRSCSRTETVRSVKLEFDNPPRSICSNQKKGTPFSVFGSTKSVGGEDNYNAVLFPLGYRKVKATPYIKEECKGIPPSKPLSKSFDVKGCIDGIEYYDADTNEMFTGNLANPPCNMNFHVKISDKCKYPVDFVLIVLKDGNGQVVAKRTSREAPYFLFGNVGIEMSTGFYHIAAYINGKQLSLDTSFTIGGTCLTQLPPTHAPTFSTSVSPTPVATPACESISIQSILGIDNPIFEFRDINVLTLIYNEFQKAALAQSSSSVAVLLPAMICADSDDDVSSLGSDAGVTSCEKLDFLADTDVLAFGLEIDGKGICAAINVETDTYALGQVGILPELPIGSIVTLSLDAVGFSLTKQLSKSTLNKMWDGTSSPAEIDVFGHVVIRGTGTIGLKLSTKVTCAIGIDTSLVIDADYLNNGVANIFDDEDDTIDFAILVSGSATPVFEITKADGEKESIDLSSLIRVDIDIYLIVAGAQTALQLAASITVSLQGICDTSPFLAIVCEVFEGESSISGAVRVYGRENEFGIQFAISGQFAFVDDILNELVGWDDDGVSFDASFQLQIAGDNVIICATIEDTIIDDWCLSNCVENSDCTDDSWCALGLTCLKRFEDRTACVPGVTCDGCKDEYWEYWYEYAGAPACGVEPKWEDGTICVPEISCDQCLNDSEYWYDYALYACGVEPKNWVDGTECLPGTSCDQCINGYEYWWGKSFTACGVEPKTWEDRKLCVPEASCNQCKNGWDNWYEFLGAPACGQEPCWVDGTTCVPYASCKQCCNDWSGFQFKCVA